MKIATFNANSIRSRCDIVVDWLSRHAPDVLCVQETKAQDADFPAAVFAAAGYRAVFRGEKSYNGVAVISRAAPDEVAFGLDDGGPADETRLAYARFGNLHVVNTYVPQGRAIDHAMYAYKLGWLARLRDYFDRHFTPRQRVLWLGDLNVAPTPLDVHNPQDQARHVCYHEDVRRAFEKTVSWGFEDVFRRRHPEAGQFTFFDYRTPNAVGRSMGWRIDHLMATRPLAAVCRDAWIDLEARRLPKPSDHTFLVGEFDL
jgi:exodeoxyribonuclease-3